jgi:undecaprenyl-diphosphatase
MPGKSAIRNGATRIRCYKRAGCLARSSPDVSVMPLLHIIVLAVVQGITEFLPISSSGHLILVPPLTGWDDQGLVIDVAVHVGTLGAVMLYFWRDVLAMTLGAGRLATGRMTEGARLALYVVLATIPVVIAGLLFKDFIAADLRSEEVVAWTTIVFGVALWLADRYGGHLRKLGALTLPHALVVGLAQALALVPGTSRSGITMTAARMLGYERTDAARFSMLLSIPTIIAAGTLVTRDLIAAGDVVLGADAALAAILSFAAALIAIAALMRWLRTASFTPFVVYRLVLGVGLLVWLYG